MQGLSISWVGVCGLGGGGGVGVGVGSGACEPGLLALPRGPLHHYFDSGNLVERGPTEGVACLDLLGPPFGNPSMRVPCRWRLHVYRIVRVLHFVALVGATAAYLFICVNPGLLHRGSCRLVRYTFV